MKNSALEWKQPRFIKSLAEATAALDRLLKHFRLPGFDSFLPLLVRREAVLSCRMDGVEAKLGDLLSVEAGVVSKRPSENLKDLANYLMAAEYGVQRLKKIAPSLKFLTELHQNLMGGAAGGSARYKHPQNRMEAAEFDAQVARRLEIWEKILLDPSLPALVRMAQAHYHFEAIHPFWDGNGRAGRLFIALFLMKHFSLPTPFFSLSAYFQATHATYDEKISAAVEGGEWEDWLDYFLKGVVHQADDILHRIQHLNGVLKEWRVLISDSPSKTPGLLIDRLVSNPYLVTSRITKQLGLSFVTAQRSVDYLAEKSIIEEISDRKWNRVYYSTEILGILEGPFTNEGLIAR